MDKPLVSVNMITYNHAPYIAQAIEGVLQQKTNFAFELVIGEDCSTDRTREVVFEYQKKYPDIIRVITSEQNVGARKNSYRTEKACRGKYIAFCDGDDYWHNPYKMQKQVDYLESHPECVMVHSDSDYYYTASGKRIKSRNKYLKVSQPYNPDISTILFDPACRIITCTVCVRRDALYKVIDSDPILYQCSRFLMGDTPRWAEISLLGKVAYIDESLGTRNVLVESGAYTKDVKKALRFSKSSSELVLYLIDKYGLAPSERRRFQKRWCISSLKLAFYERDAELAKEVKKLIQGFTLAEYLQFLGARSRFINYSLRPAVHFWRFIDRVLCHYFDD